MPMDKPNAPYPSVSTSVQSPMPFQIPDPSIRGDSWDQLLRERGIRFIHKRATPCPNMTALDDNNHDPECPYCDNAGMLYYDEREIIGAFQSNSLEKTFEQHGIWETGSAVVSMPSVYEDGTPADFNTFDQLLIPDFEIRLWQLFEYEPRPQNKQRLRYPVKKIEYMASIRGGVLKPYQVDVDFTITADGDIQWIAGREPYYNSATNMGEILTLAYFANPVYVVLQPLRELRVSQEMNAGGAKQARRLPQQILVRRDYFVNPNEKIVNKR